jgi:hypothetical protein
MAEIISSVFARLARLMGLTASAAVTATTALGATPTSSKLASALAPPTQLQQGEAVAGVTQIADKDVGPVAIKVAEALALPEQRRMPGWLVARTALDAKRSEARRRNARKPVPCRVQASPRRRATRVVWREAI